ncbi:MAG TPA: tetratricopeptide repeat protein, partial [Vicinamibacterales bacterium]
MAQPAMSAKIEELRFRLKADPKSRLFYPLAEELRKAGQVTEAEQVLRTGLGVHATYLSAWVSLGRVLRDQKKDGEAVEALSRALQLDPGNVVAARLLGDAYLSLGEKVEAIKKYKLVHALMPADEDLRAQIDALDRELHPPAPEPPSAAAAASAAE